MPVRAGLVRERDGETAELRKTGMGRGSQARGLGAKGSMGTEARCLSSRVADVPSPAVPLQTGHDHPYHAVLNPGP